MNFGTKVRTILAVATCLNTALMATDLTQFHNAELDIIYRIVSVILNFVIVACVTWFNNDYTQVAADYTEAMRAEKTSLNEDDEWDAYEEGDE